jgi:hypothetical protein
MRLPAFVTTCAAITAIVATVACGGGDSSDETPTAASSPSARASASPARPTAAATNAEGAETAEPGAPTAASGSTAPAGNQPPPAATTAPPPPPPPAGTTYTAAQATAQVNAGTLTPPDLSGAWVVQSDAPGTPVGDDATACGQLASRTVANLPADPIAAFLAGGTLSFFSNITAYATEAGAIECSNRAASRFGSPGALARAFGTLFVNPDAVVVAAFDYPQVADGSIAGTLTGQVNASGTVIDLTVLFVGFRKGNVTAVIGSARSGSVPPAAELTPLINLVLGRITAQQ